MLVKIFGILFISLFSVLYFVQREHAAALTLCLVVTGMAYRLLSLRPYFNFFLVLFLTHLFSYALKFVPYSNMWPLDLYIVAGLSFVCLKYVFKIQILPGRWNLRFSKKELLSVLIITIPTFVILLWYYSTHREVADKFPLPPMSLWLLPLVIVAAALLNGLREELIYRVLYMSVDSKAGKDALILLSQAVLFGFIHFRGGFPEGWLGVLLTGVWGLAIGMQFVIFRSTTLAWLTHSLADALMFAVIVANQS